jgi:hypothetical protein
MARSQNTALSVAEPRRLPKSVVSKAPTKNKDEHTAERGARAVAHYEDRHERYVLVTKDDLREIKGFGWLQQSLFGAGAFLFSGAFWLLINLLSEQTKYQFTSWMGMCVISMIAGAMLSGVGIIMFVMRQKRLNKYISYEENSEFITKNTR